MCLQHMSMVLRASAILHHPMDAASLAALTHAVAVHLRQYSVQEATNTLWSLALIGGLNPSLWNQMLRHLQMLLGPLDSLAGP